MLQVSPNRSEVSLHVKPSLVEAYFSQWRLSNKCRTNLPIKILICFFPKNRVNKFDIVRPMLRYSGRIWAKYYRKPVLILVDQVDKNSATSRLLRRLRNSQQFPLIPRFPMIAEVATVQSALKHFRCKIRRKLS